MFYFIFIASLVFTSSVSIFNPTKVFALDNKFEAENATRLGSARINTNHTGYSGTGFVDAMEFIGSGVQFAVNASSAGTYSVKLYYSHCMGTSQTLSVYVNGVDIVQTSLPSLASWDTWGYIAQSLTLNAGYNTITYKHDSGDTGVVNLDYISGDLTAPSRYEAESATRLGGANINNNNTGYSGSGFVDAIGNLGTGVRFTVNVATTGNYNIVLRYSNATGYEKIMSMYVNELYIRRAYFPNTPNWGTWYTIVRSAKLNAGSNTITYIIDSDDNATINLDCIDVVKDTYDLSYNASLITTAIPTSTVSPYPVTYTTSFDKNVTSFDDSQWYSKWHEKDVFGTALNHGQTNKNYTMRFGRGGQIYSYNSSIGQLMPPQTSQHAWVDDCLMMTMNQYDAQDAGSSQYAQGYIHQAGVYQHYDFDTKYLDPKSFFSPIVSERVDTTNKQYSTITWGQMSTAVSVNRADSLMYQNSRDLGDGVTEITYMAYNYNGVLAYNDRTDVSAWGGVRHSKLPYCIVSTTGGSFNVSTALFGDAGSQYDSVNTGGWIGACQDPNNMNGLAMAYVYGRYPNPYGNPTSDRFVSLGYANRDDYSVMSVNYRDYLLEGETYFFRMYLVVGTLQDVITKSNALNAISTGACEYGFINYTQTTSPTIPLYVQTINGQLRLTENVTGTPIYVYAQPVANSKPLYLIRETATGLYKVTCDPYMLNNKFQLSSNYDTKTRMAVRPYDGKSEVIKIFGYVMPYADINGGLSYSSLDNILTDSSYYPKTGMYDSENIMVRTTPN